MIGIVVVSHSAALARAAVELAGQMVGGTPPRIEIAAGIADGGFGTDAVAIAEALDRAAGDDAEGVLVVMDLGSAILSAEMALELRSSPARVVLSPAPFVEGLIGAVVLAGAGADLDTVAAEARGALAVKSEQLTDAAGPAPQHPQPVAEPEAGDAGEASFEAVIQNPSGLHARPAALFVKAASRYDADVRLTSLDSAEAPVSARSLIALMALGVHPGTRVRVTATGREAGEAIAELRALVDDGFGEL